MPQPVLDQTDYASLAEFLRNLTETVTVMPPADGAQRQALCDAAKALYLALATHAAETSDAEEIARMTPEEEVRLLHIME